MDHFSEAGTLVVLKTTTNPDDFSSEKEDYCSGGRIGKKASGIDVAKVERMRFSSNSGFFSHLHGDLFNTSATIFSEA